MSFLNKCDQLPYANTQECEAALHEVVSIDYFMARHVISLYQQAYKANEVFLPQALQDKGYNQASLITIMFHVLIALSLHQRQGSVCLPVSRLNATTFFTHPNADDAGSQSPGNEMRQGFTFPKQDVVEMMIEHVVTTLHIGQQRDVHLVYRYLHLYTKRYFDYEHNICQFISKRVNSTAAPNICLTSAQISTFKSLMPVLFYKQAYENEQIDAQQLALVNTLISRFSIITGGAGTGKTYTVSRLVIMFKALFECHCSDIALIAPTGKAANRLSESLRAELSRLASQAPLSGLCEALFALNTSTIHRLLKIDPSTGQTKYNQSQRLTQRLVVVDESSMVDISLMSKLFMALPDDCTLVLVGDANQLPSVETGSLLADLVKHPLASMNSVRWSKLRALLPSLPAAFSALSGQLSTCNDNDSRHGNATAYVNQLVASRRNSSAISLFANALLSGHVDAALNAINNEDVTLDTNDYWSEPSMFVSLLAQTALPHFNTLLGANHLDDAFELLNAFVLLSPFKQGAFGTQMINHSIEASLSKTHIHVNVGSFYKGKPIMVMQNDYQIGLYNGDIGIVWPNDSGALVAYFQDSPNTYKQVALYSLPMVEATFAMTIHKTQGSEYEQVNIILPPQREGFYTSELLYTAVTRARNHVWMAANKTVLTHTIGKRAGRVSGIDAHLVQTLSKAHERMSK